MPLILMQTIEHTLPDSLKLLPFLFLTYLVMEYLEHKASAKTAEWVRRSGRLGPLAGGLLGVVPQCGFSAAASNFYAGRVITLGTLIAVYLSTSDEMLPIMISEQAPAVLIGKVLSMKAVIGMAAGFAIDLIYRPKRGETHHIHEICEHEHCQCEKGIVRSAIRHTLQIFFFILLVGLVLEFVLQLVGEDVLENLILNRPVMGPVLAGLAGLVPNCAASVTITELYLRGALGFGSMMAGLLVNAGVGLLVLFKVNHNRKENIGILGLLYLLGISVGMALSLFG